MLLSPRHAAIVVATLLSPLTVAAQGLQLNELLAANYGSYEGFGDTHPDVIELKNAGEATVDLTGYGLSDRRDEPYRYRLPAVMLGPGGYYVVAAVGTEPSPVSGAPFKLSSEGETVYLTAPGGALVDSVAYPRLTADVAYARAADAEPWGLAGNTLGAANPTAVASGYAPAVQITGTPAELSAAAEDPPVPGLTLRYTLDGAAPTEASPAYDGPLAVSSTGVLRVRAFAPGTMPGPVATETFIDDDATALPVVALATDPANLYDPVTGIWVLGPNADPVFPFVGANFYLNRQVPTHFELFDDAAEAAAGAPAFADDVGLRVFGNFSRALPQKSSALTARRAFGSRADELEHEFFPTWPERGSDFRGLTLRNGGNDFRDAVFRDGLVATLARRTEASPMAYQPVVTYVNGELYGVQALRERPNEHTAARRAGVDVDEIDLIENRGNGDPLTLPPDNGTLEAYADLVAWFDRTDFAAPAAYDSFASRFALDNFLDYYATQVYVANEDWPGNNNRVYRVREPGARWHYLLYDADFSYGADKDSQADDPGALARLLDPNGPDYPNPPQATRFFRSAMANARLRAAFGNRVADLLNFDYRPAEALAVIDSLAALIGPEVPRLRALYDPEGAWIPWAAEVDTMRGFARRRPAGLRDALRSQLGFGADASLALAIAGEPTSGAIVVNDYRRVSAGPWAGTYFAGTDVTLRAEATPGFTFLGWEGLPAGADPASPTVRLDPAAVSGTTVTAVFGPDERPLPSVYVNEVNYRSPDALDAGDWVELYNPSEADVSLAGFTLTDDDPAGAYAFPAGATLPARGFAVVARDSADFAAVHPDVAFAAEELPFGLSGAGDVVVLRDETGRVVDSLRYEATAPWPEAAAGAGPTLELIRTRDFTGPERDRPGSWQASFVDGGTPGAENSVRTTGSAAAGLSAKLLAYPVPTGDVVRIRVPAGGGALVALDLLGREVERRGLGADDEWVDWSLGDLPGGRYTVVLVRGAEVTASVGVLVE